MTAAANKFLQLLNANQKTETQFLFEDEERYNWHYIPKDRKGIALKQLTEDQYKAAMDLLRTALSDTGYQKTTAIIKLENVLREVESRPEGDTYRDPGNYRFTIFGNPSDSIWGWRLEGHHISFNFSAQNNSLVSGTWLSESTKMFTRCVSAKKVSTVSGMSASNVWPGLRVGTPPTVVDITVPVATWMS